LSAVLTIWRYGRQLDQAGSLEAGEALGSYERWCRWCRDPLLALGCQDPVARIHELRAADPARENLAELFGIWWENHQDKWVSPVTRMPAGAEALAAEVRGLADRENRGPQHLRTFLNRLDNTRAAGFVFEGFKDPRAPTIPSTYRIKRAVPAGGSG
jgi:putative DNA primase/helicase